MCTVTDVVALGSVPPLCLTCCSSHASMSRVGTPSLTMALACARAASILACVGDEPAWALATNHSEASAGRRRRGMCRREMCASMRVKVPKIMIRTRKYLQR